MLIMEDNSNSMLDTLKNIEYIYVTQENKNERIEKSSKDYNKLVNNLKDVYKRGILMPAFGVSIHNETLNAMKSGKWLELVYECEQEKNGLLYTSLLIKLEDGYGFNIIRKYDGKYEGRCFYLSLENEMHLGDILP